ncbi:TIGR03826 family flagellar region protein [Bacillus sp. FJAT-45066]|uniref:TIGR03826 family flagellar region protein n=1 Tax=Bacillus sp. FJAT-45066 TaxID=2011010 RepID=UPI000BB71181|nr:TIGR03826 family flagellar region protein [Bacillus sp. FJAT-45066]
MSNVENCPNCGAIFVKNAFREVCTECAKAEEKIFDEVYKFIRKRANRTATMEQVVEATGATESLLVKFIKKGRISLAQFPNLGYPCDRCGEFTRTGRLCVNCSSVIQTDLAQAEREDDRKKEALRASKTYYAVDRAKGNWEK